MKKIKIRPAVVVEGKYDKITLSQIIDGVIIVTNGFGIYNDEETLRLLRFYAKERGLAILTDSDRAGQKIRGKIKSIVPDGKIVNVYIPQIAGKEKRKALPSKEGTLGVEGMSAEIIVGAFEKAGLLENDEKPKRKITKNDFCVLGLSGSADSVSKRKELSEKLGLPSGLSSSALRDAVCTMFDREDFIEFYRAFDKEQK